MQALEQEDNKTIDPSPSKEPESAFISLSSGEDRRKRHSYHERLLMANHEIRNGAQKSKSNDVGLSHIRDGDLIKRVVTR